MGQPVVTVFGQMASPAAECIGRVEITQGTETSKYLQERKSSETPSVAASESGHSPNQSSDWGCGARVGVTKASIVEGSWKGPPQKVKVL